MKRPGYIFLVSLCVLACVVWVTPVFGQTLPDTSTELGNVISISTSPKYISPNQSVRVILNSYSFDLNAATMRWYSGGKLVLSGQGKTELTLTTGDVGEKKTVTVDVSVNGKNFEKSIELLPESVDLIWQANTYTPPFYEGKALSAIKVLSHT